MTQRVARPMKFAAFISIIISVAVMLAACQGAAGKPGADGNDGVQGPKGEPGDQGLPGEGVFRSWLAPVLVYINDTKDIDGAIKLGPKTPINLSEYHRGGTGPFEYAVDSNVKIANSDSNVLKGDAVPKPDKTGMVTVELHPDQATAKNYQTVRLSYTVTDLGKDTITIDARVARNQSPVYVRKGNGGKITQVPVRIGISTAHYKDSSGTKFKHIPKGSAKALGAGTDGKRLGFDCKTLNDCSLKVLVGTDFTDDDYGPGDLQSSNALSFTATSRDPGKVSASVMDGKIVLTGHASTNKRDVDGMCTKDDTSVYIDVTASDRGFLSVEANQFFAVTVDEPPMLSKAITPKSSTIDKEKDATVADLGVFFKDCETSALQYYGHSSDKDYLSLDNTTSDVIVVEGKKLELLGSSELSVTSKISGSVTITVAAVDEAGQYATGSFSVTVKK